MEYIIDVLLFFLHSVRPHSRRNPRLGQNPKFKDIVCSLLIDTEQVMASDSAPLLIEQMSKAFFELEACNAAAGDKVHWKEMVEHFLNLDAAFKKKIIELEAKEMEFEQKESETSALIADREVAVAAKEQDMLDRVQELKDVAVAAVLAVASICDTSDLQEEVTHAAGGSKDIKVSSSFNGRNSAVEDFPPNGTVENVEDVVRSDVKPRPELVQFCQQMDAPGLVSYTLENKKKLYLIRSELSVALESAAEPARFVLDLLEEYYTPPNATDQSDDERDGGYTSVSKSHLIFLEAMAAFMGSRANPEGGSVLNHEIRQQAKEIADEWMLKLASEESTDDAKGHHYSLRAALLQLLATFGIASEFDPDELCKLVLAVAQRKQAPSLCRSLGLSEKIPDIIQMLIKSSRQVDAVRFIHAFHLTDSFPPVPLLKAYLKELRRNSQGKGMKAEGSADPQIDVNARELAAIKSVIGSVKEFHLEASYSLEPLQKRLEQLENMRSNKKRGPGGDRGDRDYSRKAAFKKLKSKGGGGPHNNNKHRAGQASAFVPRGGAPFSAAMGRYTQPQPPINHVAHHHQSYEPSHQVVHGQSTYSHSQQPFDPRSFNAATTNYTTYTSNGLHTAYPPYM